MLIDSAARPRNPCCDTCKRGAEWFISFPARPTSSTLALMAEISEGDFELPFQPGNHHEPRTSAKSAFTALQEANYDHPMLKKFRETGASGRDPIPTILRNRSREDQGADSPPL